MRGVGTWCVMLVCDMWCWYVMGGVGTRCVILVCDAWCWYVICNVGMWCVVLVHDVWCYVMRGVVTWCVMLVCDVWCWYVMCDVGMWCVVLVCDAWCWYVMRGVRTCCVVLVCDTWCWYVIRDVGIWCVIWYRICDFVMLVETRDAAEFQLQSAILSDTVPKWWRRDKDLKGSCLYVLCKTQKGPGRVSNPVHPTTYLEGVHERCHIHIYHRHAVAMVCRRAVWVNYYVIYITVNGAATFSVQRNC
jgi:hypothetical protein